MIETPIISAAAEFSPAELRRFARHISLPGVGLEGQLRLKRGSVLVIGAGGLGCPALLYLAAAGVGRLGIIDPDTVSDSNLQRQILYTTDDTGKLKTECAARRLRALNPDITVETWPEAFTAANALRIAERFDILLDATDNFPARYLASDTAVWLKKPDVYGSIFRFEGQVSVFAPHLGAPCHRCMFPVPPAPGAVPACSEAGVMGVLPGLVGTLQAAEAVKLLTGIGDPLLGRMLHADCLGTRFREFKMKRDPQCPVCGENPSITGPVDYEGFCGLPSASDTLEAAPADLPRLRETHFILDVREPWEHALLPFPADRWVPHDRLENEWSTLPRERPVLAVCRLGLRSRESAELLRRSGHPGALSLRGGTDALG